MSQADGGSDSVPGASRYGWYVAGILMLSYAVQHIDRQIVSICLEQLRHEFKASDSQLGFLSGLSFAIAYAVAVLPLGALADRLSRKNMLSWLMFIWSALTGLAYLATSFSQLVAARIVVGAVESGANPAAVSMLSDYFDRGRRSAATGLYFFGQGIGIFGGFAIGGYIAAEHGWRMAFLVAGLPGLFLALVLFLTVREPRRGAQETIVQKQESLSFAAAFRWILGSRSLVLVMIGAVLSSMVVAAFVVWIATFLVRHHDLSLAQAGLAVGLGLGLSGAAGAAVGGFISDFLNRRSFRYAPIFVGAMILAMVPFSLAALWVPSAVGCIILASIALSVAHAKDGPSFACIVTLARPDIRARTVSMLTLFNNLIGFGLGTQLVGLVSDAYKPALGDASLRYAMMTVMFVGLPAAALCWLAARTAEADLARAERRDAA